MKGTDYKIHDHCRVCGNDKLVKYIDLGHLPLCNNFLNSPYDFPDRYPLEVMLCEDCGLSQLSIVIKPDLLFSNYAYRSSISKGYIDHCRLMAKQLKEEYGLTEDSFMIDIAGNDGALLKEFYDEIGLDIMNVDPAKNIGAIARKNGIPTEIDFWSTQLAEKLVSEVYKADLITATNVFAHVDDVYDFLNGVKIMLRHTGVLILEFPYLLDFLENIEFDTIYFEHLSYFSIKPIKRLCQKLGLTVMKVEKESIHGGTVRVHIGYGKEQPSVKEFIDKENLLALKDYETFSENSRKAIKEFREGVLKLKEGETKIFGFAASAKGNTLLNCAGINFKTIPYIIDETPEKVGKYYPGTMILVKPLSDLSYYKVSYLVILSWNFKEEIMRKVRADGYEGKFIIPIPEFKIID